MNRRNRRWNPETKVFSGLRSTPPHFRRPSSSDWYRSSQSNLGTSPWWPCKLVRPPNNVHAGWRKSPSAGYLRSRIDQSWWGTTCPACSPQSSWRGWPNGRKLPEQVACVASETTENHLDIIWYNDVWSAPKWGNTEKRDPSIELKPPAVGCGDGNSTNSNHEPNLYWTMFSGHALLSVICITRISYMYFKAVAPQESDLALGHPWVSLGQPPIEVVFWWFLSFEQSE